MRGLKMNIYLVYGEESDGTYMYHYSSFNVVAASNEEEARKLNSALLGKSENYIVKFIGKTDIYKKACIIEQAITLDY